MGPESATARAHRGGGIRWRRFKNNETLSFGDFTSNKDVFVLPSGAATHMVDDHILEGAITSSSRNASTAIRRQEIVVALVDGQDATLKRIFRKEGTQVRLQP